MVIALEVNNNPEQESHLEVAVVAWAAGDAPQVWRELKVAEVFDWVKQELVVGHGHLMYCRSS